jgi:sugar/nucleoside kinase (ribokinase family)
MFLSIGSLLIDDIVLANGETHLGVLGGGAVHAAFAMRLWHDAIGLVVAAGQQFPADAAQELQRNFDTRGVIWRAAPVARAWQLFKWDSQRGEFGRSEIWRTSFADFRRNLPAPDEVLPDLGAVEGAYLECDAPQPLLRWIDRLRQAGCPVLVWEPWASFYHEHDRTSFRQLAPLVDVVSPNLAEAQRLTALQDPEQIAIALCSDGASAVALRLGAQGSLIARPGQKPILVKAVQSEKIVDVTGAGNAYCGGLVVGLAETGNLTTAAHYASATASFALEQFGPIVFSVDKRREAQRRRSA